MDTTTMTKMTKTKKAKKGGYEVVKIIEIEEDGADVKFRILDEELYRWYKRPMAIYGFGDVEMFNKPDIPICDCCNGLAEYVVIQTYRREKYMVSCVCNRCKQIYQ